MSPTEEWRTIASHPDYQVSAAGQVRRVAPRFRHPTMGILKPRVDRSTGYQKVKLDGATRPIHVLVCEAFSGPRPEGKEVRHLNGDESNNLAANLAWGTRRENNLDAVSHGTNPLAAKSACVHGHLLAAPNLVRSKLKAGHRNCRACNQGRAAFERATRRGEPVTFQELADMAFTRLRRQVAD